jgi:hypothetical protein
VVVVGVHLEILLAAQAAAVEVALSHLMQRPILAAVAVALVIQLPDSGQAALVLW